mmetsp:Transcript_30122/g.54951  ORF Transcript_30122/g.54951 Transcript_30122/m.54951 type:complete len:285 (-) Transcript_30122:66-920(-)
MSFVVTKRPTELEVHQEGSLKRRRIFSAAEVEQGLREANLFQPVLGALRGAKRALSEPHAGVVLEEPHSEANTVQRTKRACRQRLGHSTSASSSSELMTLTPNLGRAAWLTNALVEANLNQSLVPATPLRIMKPPHRIAVDPAGIAFIVSEHGFLMAELPSCWQPTVSLGDRVVSLAKVAIDSKGTAYLFGANGELLTTIAAVRCLEDRNAMTDLRIRLLGGDQNERQLYMGMHGTKVIIEEEGEDTTDVPSPSEQGDELDDMEEDEGALEWQASDGSMDWEAL